MQLVCGVTVVEDFIVRSFQLLFRLTIGTCLYIFGLKLLTFFVLVGLEAMYAYF